jgi:F-type H+-transporting ATPase subunit b
MEINWVTFIAQIVNFIILLVLLKILLYRRIVNAMKAREEKIASSLDEAKKMKEKAEKEIEEYSTKKKELEDMREDLLFKVKQEVEGVRHDLLEKARENADLTHQRWLKSLEEKEQGFLNEVQNRVGKQVYEISKRALIQLADAQLEEQMLNVFLVKLEALSDEDIGELRVSINKPGSGIRVISSFDIPEPARRKIKSLFDERIGKDMPVEFDTSPDLICGIKIKTREIEITWSLEDYLDTLQQDLAEVFNEEIRTKKQSPVKDADSREDTAQE